VPDQPTDDESQKPPEVDMGDGANVRYWCQLWQVTEAELAEAVSRVGVSAPAVAFALGKEAYGDSLPVADPPAPPAGHGP